MIIDRNMQVLITDAAGFSRAVAMDPVAGVPVDRPWSVGWMEGFNDAS
jgi:hypothetical protein